jgi:hypothetical protein
VYLFENKNISRELLPHIRTLHDAITWLPKANQETMREYYLHDWDLVIGSLYKEKPYAILNMIELESMAYQLPILAIDHYETLFYPIEAIEEIAKKLVSDRNYRNEYTKKNLDYILEHHAPKRVSERYRKLLETRIFS